MADVERCYQILRGRLYQRLPLLALPLAKVPGTIGAGFSGSFPTLNLAVLAAGEAMNVKVIYIASMGASTFGANQPQFTFPDMVCRLYLDGRLQTPHRAVIMTAEVKCLRRKKRRHLPALRPMAWQISCRSAISRQT